MIAPRWLLVCRADGADLVVLKGQSAVVPKVPSAAPCANLRVDPWVGMCLPRFMLPPVKPIRLLIYDG
jgi:hypothetical protein